MIFVPFVCFHIILSPFLRLIISTTTCVTPSAHSYRSTPGARVAAQQAPPVEEGVVALTSAWEVHPTRVTPAHSTEGSTPGAVMEVSTRRAQWGVGLPWGSY